MSSGALGGPGDLSSVVKKVNAFHKRIFLEELVSGRQGEVGHLTDGGEGNGEWISFLVGRTSCTTTTFCSLRFLNFDVIENAIIAVMLMGGVFFNAFSSFLTGVVGVVSFFFFFVAARKIFASLPLPIVTFRHKAFLEFTVF